MMVMISTDKIGPTMDVLRQDIHQNLQRLEKFHESNPSVYSNVVEILKEETGEGKAKIGPSCSKAFVWLTRSLDFAVAWLQLLVEDFGRKMEEAVEASYSITLKPWHGWTSSAAYRIIIQDHLCCSLAFPGLTPTNERTCECICRKAYCSNDQVALKLVPDSKTLITLLKAKDENDDMLKEELQTLISSLVPC